MNQAPIVSKRFPLIPTAEVRVRFDGLVSALEVARGFGFPTIAFLRTLRQQPEFPPPIFRQGYKHPMWSSLALAQWATRAPSQMKLRAMRDRSAGLVGARAQGKKARAATAQQTAATATQTAAADAAATAAKVAELQELLTTALTELSKLTGRPSDK